MMPESWLPFFEWCEATRVGTAVRESVWLFPMVEAAHLLALCTLGGALLVVDLRMLGLGLRQQTISELAHHVRPWLIGSIALMVATGVPLFLSEAVKCFYNASFAVKMTVLPLAMLFTFAVRESFARKHGPDATMRSRLIGAASLAIWFVVAAAGRWIGFS